MRSLSQFLRSVVPSVFNAKRSTRRLRSRILATAAFVETCESRELLSTFSIGTLIPEAPTVERSGSITMTNSSDDYTFHINDTAQVRVAIFGLKEDLNVTLLGPGSSVIGSSSLPSGNIDGFITTTIGTTGSTTGPYTVRVTQGEPGAVSRYDVSVSIVPNSDDVITNATDLGSLDSAESTNVQRSGVVGTASDPVDFYRFTTVQSASNLRATSSGIGGTLLYLLDSGGRILKASDGQLTHNDLFAGTYYLRVQSSSPAASRNYSLSATVSLGTIDIFGTPKVGIVGSVGGGAAPEDNAAFSIAAAGSFEFELKDQTTAVGYDIRNESDQVVFSASANSSPNRSMTTLPAGNYRIRVFSGTGLVSPYSLSGAISMTGSWSHAGQIDPGLKPTIRFQPPRSQFSVDGKSWRGIVSTTAATPLKLNLLPLAGVPVGTSLSMLAFNSSGTLLAWNNNSVGSYLEAVLPPTSPDVRIFVTSTAVLPQPFELSVTSDFAADDQFWGAPSWGLNTNTPTARRTGVTGNTADIIDSYSINLQSAGRFLTALSWMTANLNLEILNSKGRRIASSSQTGTTFDQVLTQELPADDYFVRVVTPYFGLGAAPTTASPYVLETTIETLSDDTVFGAKAGGTISTGRPTYAFTAPSSAAPNIQDYHQFTLTAQLDIRINLGGLSSDLDVELLNTDGVVLQTGQSSGIGAEDFVRTGLAAGIYYVRVFHKTPNAPLLSGYQLTVTRNVSPAAPEGQDRTISMNEDADRFFQLADFPMTDTDVPANFLKNVKITTLPAKGTLTLTNSGGTTAVTAGQLIAASVINAGQLKYRPALNDHGTSYTSFTFQVQDNGAVISGDADLDPTPNTTTFNVSNINDAPTLTSTSVVMPSVAEDSTSHNGLLVSEFANIISDVDPDALKGIAVTNAPTTRGIWQYALDGTTWQSLSGSSITAARLLAADATTRVRFLPNANATGDATLTFLAWDRIEGTAGSLVRLVDFPSSNTFSVASATLSVTVTNVNDAPTLAQGNVLLTSINEDTTDPTGTLVSSLLAGMSDVDAGAVKGMAVRAVQNSGGVWQYTLNNGANWTPFGSVSAASARLLPSDDNTRVRFVPNANFSGNRGINFYAWDQTSGTAGSTVDLSLSSSKGGTTAFSTDIELGFATQVVAAGERCTCRCRWQCFCHDARNYRGRDESGRCASVNAGSVDQRC